MIKVRQDLSLSEKDMDTIGHESGSGYDRKKREIERFRQTQRETQRGGETERESDRETERYRDLYLQMAIGHMLDVRILCLYVCICVCTHVYSCVCKSVETQINA